MSSKGTPVKVAICVPSFRGTIMTQTCTSLISTVWMMAELGIGMEFTNVDSAEIVTIRNSMASKVVKREDLTHLLFIDDDMMFEADTVISLLRADKDVVGAVCPYRKLNLEAFQKAAREGKSVQDCTAAATEFVVRHYPEQVQVQEGLFKIRGIGMAVTLIKRRALLKMIEKGVVEKRERPPSLGPDTLGNTHIYGFFDPVVDVDSTSLLSEDFSFCQRWIKDCGDAVWALADNRIGHIGPYVYSGTYMERLKLGMV
jgi:hypothetical protein